jgi:hypothetical protein
VKNLGTFDRLIRVFLAELCILIAFFWAGKAWQMVLYLIAIVMVFQAATGVCGFYNLLGWNTCERIKRNDKNLVMGTVVLLFLTAFAGSYASIVTTKNILKDDIRSVEEPYNLTLLSTYQDQMKESISQYELLNTSLSAFDKRYTDYMPFAIKFDEKFQEDVQNISLIVKASRQDIYTGHLSEAHRSLEAARPMLQSIKIRDDLG